MFAAAVALSQAHSSATKSGTPAAAPAANSGHGGLDSGSGTSSLSQHVNTQWTEAGGEAQGVRDWTAAVAAAASASSCSARQGGSGSGRPGHGWRREGEGEERAGGVEMMGESATQDTQAGNEHCVWPRGGVGAPIIFIDEIDVLCPKRDARWGNVGMGMGVGG